MNARIKTFICEGMYKLPLISSIFHLVLVTGHVKMSAESYLKIGPRELVII